MDIKREVLALENEKSTTDGWATMRDGHVESPRLWTYTKSPATTGSGDRVLGSGVRGGARQYV